MAGWIHFAFETASVVSLFVVRPQREPLRILHTLASDASEGLVSQWSCADPGRAPSLPNTSK